MKLKKSDHMLPRNRLKNAKQKTSFQRQKRRVSYEEHS